MKSSTAAVLTVAIVFLAALAAHPAAAGSATAPEVKDVTADELTGLPADPALQAANVFQPADVVNGWVSGENTTTFYLNVGLSGDPQAGAVNAAALGFTASYTYNFNFVYAGTSLKGTVTCAAAPGVPAAKCTASNVATAVTFPTPKVMNMTILKSKLAAVVPAGSQMGSLFIDSSGLFLGMTGTVTSTDRAPDAPAFGLNYTFAQGPSGGLCPKCLPNDTDGDGLNDTWEMTHFNNLNQTGAADPDADGLNNTQEQSLKTDPNKADTDGDGIPDGTEVTNGTNPLDPNSPPPTTSSTTSSTSSSTSSSGEDGDNGTGSTSSKSAIDNLKANPQYLGFAGGGALVVIVLSLIGRFGRWGL